MSVQKMLFAKHILEGFLGHDFGTWDLQFHRSCRNEKTYGLCSQDHCHDGITIIIVDHQSSHQCLRKLVATKINFALKKRHSFSTFLEPSGTRPRSCIWTSGNQTRKPAEPEPGLAAPPGKMLRDTEAQFCGGTTQSEVTNCTCLIFPNANRRLYTYIHVLVDPYWWTVVVIDDW